MAAKLHSIKLPIPSPFDGGGETEARRASLRLPRMIERINSSVSQLITMRGPPKSGGPPPPPPPDFEVVEGLEGGGARKPARLSQTSSCGPLPAGHYLLVSTASHLPGLLWKPNLEGKVGGRRRGEGGNHANVLSVPSAWQPRGALCLEREGAQQARTRQGAGPGLPFLAVPRPPEKLPLHRGWCVGVQFSPAPSVLSVPGPTIPHPPALCPCPAAWPGQGKENCLEERLASLPPPTAETGPWPDTGLPCLAPPPGPTRGLTRRRGPNLGSSQAPGSGRSERGDSPRVPHMVTARPCPHPALCPISQTSPRLTTPRWLPPDGFHIPNTPPAAPPLFSATWLVLQAWVHTRPDPGVLASLCSELAARGAGNGWRTSAVCTENLRGRQKHRRPGQAREKDTGKDMGTGRQGVTHCRRRTDRSTKDRRGEAGTVGSLSDQHSPPLSPWNRKKNP